MFPTPKTRAFDVNSGIPLALFRNWCLWGHFIMARKAQTIVANGAQRLSGFILSLPRSAQSRQKNMGARKSAAFWQQVAFKNSTVATSCKRNNLFSLFFSSLHFLFFSVAQLFGECQSSFVSYIQSWLKWLRCWAEDTDTADLFCISSKYCLGQALRALHFTPSPWTFKITIEIEKISNEALTVDYSWVQLIRIL